MGHTSRRPRGQSQLRALRRHGFRVVPELSTTTTASTAITLLLFLPSIRCAHLPVFPFFIARFVRVSPVEELQLELPRFILAIMYLRRNLGRVLGD